MVVYRSDIKVSELPEAIARVIRREHSGYDIDDAAKLEKDGATYYQVELDANGKQDKHLVFTTDGKPAQGVAYLK